MHGELTKQQTENILLSQSVCRIACIDGKFPYIVPLNYFYDGKYIYAQSQEGKKIKALRKNPNVCIQVDIVNSMNNWQSVIIYGEFEELKGEESEKARALLFDSIFTLMTNAKTHKFEHNRDAIIDDSNRIKLIMFRIKLLETMGRFEKQ